MSQLGDSVNREIKHLDGIRIRTCVQSGFCCTTAPCEYGEKRKDSNACKYLSEANEIGQKFCGRYEWIMQNAPDPENYPAFGGGCCMPIGNTVRLEILEKLKKIRLDFEHVL
jgi:hypothetical protein